jgi:regulator of replication initiation timing
MGSKDKTISFRVREERFEALKAVSDEMDPSLSQIFRDFVHVFNDHKGRVAVVPKHDVPHETESDDLRLHVEVPKSRIREHEQLELETEHLREELNEYKQYASHLQDEVDAIESAREDMIVLEDLDIVSDFRVASD